MPTHPATQPLSQQHQPYRVVGEFRELLTPAGRVWQFVSESAELVDHAWQQRERLHQLSDGASRFEVLWHCEDLEVVVSHDPELPAA